VETVVLNDAAACYGEAFAPYYDDVFASSDDPQVVAGFLAPLAGNGRALELGIGTGRFALPLAARGVPVFGIDASVAMLARLRAHPAGSVLPLTVGDFTDLPLAGPFRLIYIVYNTLFMLPNAEAQARCLYNVAARLSKDGAFVVEAFVPTPGRFSGANATRLEPLATGGFLVTAAEDDPATQTVTLRFNLVRNGATIQLTQRLCYASPAQIDALALAAGLHRDDCWAGWQGEPFSETSLRRVALYRRAAYPLQGVARANGTAS
jgi:SAM-dependent methyltransferase